MLRWHRDLITRRHAAISRPRSAGRPPTARSIRTLVLRLAREHNGWGYRRIHGELPVLGIKVAASTRVGDPQARRHLATASYPALFDAILADTGITIVLSGVQIPRINSIIERWIQTCRHELLDRTLIWNRRNRLFRCWLTMDGHAVRGAG